MSSIFKLCRFSNRGIATTGPTPISSGSTPAATKPRKMPSGSMPFCAATASLMTTQADAPSDNWLALPALMVLPSNTGLMPASPSAVVSGRGPSSCDSVTCWYDTCLVALSMTALLVVEDPMPQQHLLLGEVGLRVWDAHFVRVIFRDESAHLVPKRGIFAGKLRFHGGFPLPVLAERANFQFKRPGALRLLIEQPVGLGDRRWRHQEIRVVERVGSEGFDPALPHPFGVDPGIDDQMRDMNVLRAKLARGRLRSRAQAELGAGEGGIAGAATQGGGGASEENIAGAARQHQLRRLPARQESRIAGHLPDLPEHPFGGIQDREIDIGADVEDADLERRMLVGIAKERDDLLLLAGIERTGVDFAAGGFDRLHQRIQLGAIAAAREHRDAVECELPGDLAADIVAGADHRHGRVSLLQGHLLMR